jgi:dihydroorotase
MSVRPARIGRVEQHGRTLEPGAPAHVTLVDPAARRVVDRLQLASLSRNTPFHALELPGVVVATFLGGRPTVLDGKLQ